MKWSKAAREVTITAETVNDLYAFLRCDSNTEVGAIHPKAMHVVFSKPDEGREIWLNAEWVQAGKLQRPLADGSLKVVVRGGKQDGEEHDEE